MAACLGQGAFDEAAPRESHGRRRETRVGLDPPPDWARMAGEPGEGHMRDIGAMLRLQPRRLAGAVAFAVEQGERFARRRTDPERIGTAAALEKADTRQPDRHGGA